MPTPTDRLWRRAHDYLARGQVQAGQAALEALLARDPAFVHAHLVLGGIAWRQDRMDDAVQHARAAARVAADDAPALLAAIAGLLQVGENAAARECLQSPPLAGTGDGNLLAHAAGLAQRLGDHPMAMGFNDRARAAGANEPEFRLGRAMELSFNGRLQEAEAEFENCLAHDGTVGRAHVELVRLRRQTPEHNQLDALRRSDTRVAPGSIDAGALAFARYKALEDLGRPEEAVRELLRGNAIMATLTRYDAAREQALHAGLRRIFASPLHATDSGHEGPAPIFIVGMTRSGTTLLDRILGNHSLVESAGELADFARQLRHVAGRCTLETLDERLLERLADIDHGEVGRRYLAQAQWRANGRPFFVDKLPSNWMLAGPIHLALPRARIVHLVRDPMDVCFSNLRAFYADAHGWSYEQERLAHYHGQYRRMMAHWHAVMPGRILDVAYADLVREPEATVRRVFEFCGLDFEDGCLDLSRNRTTVATLSLAQVRGGIRADAFGEWLPYQEALAPLRAALDSQPG